MKLSFCELECTCSPSRKFSSKPSNWPLINVGVYNLGCNWPQASSTWTGKWWTQKRRTWTDWDEKFSGTPEKFQTGVILVPDEINSGPEKTPQVHQVLGTRLRISNTHPPGGSAQGRCPAPKCSWRKWLHRAILGFIFALVLIKNVPITPLCKKMAF